MRKTRRIDILDDVERFFERSLNLAAGAGVPFGRSCSIRASDSARPGSKTTPASGISTASDALARRSWSGSPANRSSAGSSTRRSIGVSRARSPPTRSRSCGALRCCACMTSLKTGPRSPSSWRSRPPPRLPSRRSRGMTNKRASSSRSAAMSATKPSPAPGAARDLEQSGIRTDRGLPPLPHGALGQDRPGLVCQRLRAWEDEPRARGAARPGEETGGRARPQARGALGSAGHRHRPHRLR